MIFLKIAWRSITRNTRRSIITLIALSIAVAGLIYLQAQVNGENTQVITNSTEILSGQIQVHKKGFIDDPMLSKRIKEPQKVSDILSKEPNILAFTPRLESGGLLSTGDKSIGSGIIGIQPSSEKNVTTMYKGIMKGGRYLNDDDTKKIILGKRVADKLNVVEGGMVIILTQAADGSIGADKYELVGRLDTGMEEVDDMAAFITLRDAQELLSTGDEISGFAMSLKNKEKMNETIKNLKPLEDMGLENDPWQKLVPFLVTVQNMHRAVLDFFLFVMFIIIGIGIMNTIHMSTLERTREFGIMLAVGTTPAQLLRIVIYEALMLGGLGVITGSLLGLALTGYFAYYGIDLSSYGEETLKIAALSDRLYPIMEPGHFITTAVWIMLITVVVSIYPATRASGIEPVSAIRGISTAVFYSVRINKLWEKIFDSIFRDRYIFAHMAWHNITRNMTRSVITIVAIASGLGFMMFFYALVDGMYEQMINNSTRYISGDLQISTKEYRDDPSPSASIKDPDELMKILSAKKDIQFTPRVQSEALLSTAEKSVSVFFIGIDIESDRTMSGFDRSLKEGDFLKPDDKRGVVLGTKMAEKLNAVVGDKVVIMAQDINGDMNSEAYTIRGIIGTGVDSVDSILVLTNLKSAQSLLGITSVSTVLVKIKDKYQADAIRASMINDIHGTGNEMYTWRELMPILDAMINKRQVAMNIILVIIFGIILLGAMNTILMSVMERTREFGMMMALGTQPSYIVKLVLYELAILGTLGVLAGNLLGLLIVGYLHNGIDLAMLSPGISMSKYPGGETVIMPIITLGSVLTSSAIMYVMALLIGLYPAKKAASLEPVEAMRRS